MPERVSEQAQSYYADRFITYLEQDKTPGEAAELADLDLLEWSQPLELPEGDTMELWS